MYTITTVKEGKRVYLSSHGWTNDKRIAHRMNCKEGINSYISLIQDVDRTLVCYAWPA